MHDPIEPVSRTNCQQGVDVIGHHAPGDQHITIGIEGQKHGLNQFGDSRNCQIAPAMPLIESGIDDSDAIAGARMGQFVSQSGRKAVGQSEDNMLNKTGAIKMGEIAARAPLHIRGTGRRNQCRRDAGGPRIAGTTGTAGLRPDAGGPKSHFCRGHP